MSRAGAHHRLYVQAQLGALRLHARLEFAAPWTVIFGPSGSGKSSLLRGACGLLEAGQVEFAACAPAAEATAAAAAPAHDRAWVEMEGPARRTPSHLRDLAYAPQGAALFPHMTVRENVAFALHSRRPQPRQTIEQAIQQAIELFDLDALAGRHPRDLSGGERQRVNLARAFAVPQPRLMLLDEPFTGVDRALRDALLPRMAERLAALGVPAISVTHDVEEALLLGAEVVRLDAGRVVAQGPALDVLALERERMLRVLNSEPATPSA
jgi:molybdate transport system ATP-binding protein